MPAEIITEKIELAPGDYATRTLGPNEFVNVSAPPTQGLIVIQEIRFTDETGEHYRITAPKPHQSNVAMNTRGGDTVYEFSRKRE